MVHGRLLDINCVDAKLEKIKISSVWTKEMNFIFSDENVVSGTGYSTSVEKIGLTLDLYLASPFISHVI